MPLISVETIDTLTDTRLALWHITETVDELLSLETISSVDKNEVLNCYKSKVRQCEALVVRALLQGLFKTNVALSHNIDGCPFLDNGFNVSISHTKGWAAVIISKDYNVSVDVEYVSPRIMKIKDKFLRNDEKADGVTSALLHWCAKETVYKLYSVDHLTFEEMRVSAVKGNSMKGLIVIENMRRGVKRLANYCVTEDYVLVYDFVK